MSSSIWQTRLVHVAKLLRHLETAPPLTDLHDAMSKALARWKKARNAWRDALGTPGDHDALVAANDELSYAIDHQLTTQAAFDTAGKEVEKLLKLS